MRRLKTTDAKRSGDPKARWDYASLLCERRGNDEMKSKTKPIVYEMQRKREPNSGDTVRMDDLAMTRPESESNAIEAGPLKPRWVVVQRASGGDAGRCRSSVSWLMVIWAGSGWNTKQMGIQVVTGDDDDGGDVDQGREGDVVESSRARSSEGRTGGDTVCMSRTRRQRGTRQAQRQRRKRVGVHDAANTANSEKRHTSCHQSGCCAALYRTVSPHLRLKSVNQSK